MDLLQYLLVPGAAPLTGSRQTTDSVPPTPLDLGSGTYKGDGDQRDAGSPSLPEVLPTKSPSFMPTSVSEQAMIEPAQSKDESSSVVSPSKKICHFWYHFGHCSRDASESDQTGKPCVYMHAMPAAGQPIIVKRVPHFMHKFECDLEFCPHRKRCEADRATGRIKQPEPRREPLAQPGIDADVVNGPSEGASKAKKRKRNRRHPDQPIEGLPSTTKRPRISYEDLYSDPAPQLQAPPVRKEKSSSSSKIACFFWYHGVCRRGRDRQGCSMRHALSDPPEMVKLPPGYVHRSPCELEWCPGDAPAKHTCRPQQGERKDKPERAGRDSRYFDGDLLDTDDESSADDSEEKPGEQEWYLSGFD